MSSGSAMVHIDPKTESYITEFNVEERHGHTFLRPVLPARMPRLATVAEPNN